MSSKHDAILKAKLEGLTELGLSMAQAHVYVVLLSLGPSLARTVSKMSGLSREDTYRALRMLKAMGLVEVIMNKPYTFAAVEPSAVVKILLGQLDNKFNLLKQKALEMGEWLEGIDRIQQGPDESPPERYVFKLEGGTQIFEQMSKLIQSCKSELVRITSATGISQNHVLGIFDQEKEIVKKGVRIRAITELKTSNREVVEEYANIAELRHVEGLGSSLKFVIADDSQMIFFTSNPTQNVRDLGAIWTNNKPLIEGFKKEFEQRWLTATPVSKALEQSGKSSSNTVGGRLPHPSKL